MQLEKVVVVELLDFKLDWVMFIVEMISEFGQCSCIGIDQFEFYVQINLGIKLGFMMKVVFGGELLCFLLVLKVCFVDKGFVFMLVFDEIDIGVGGVVVEVIGVWLVCLVGSVQVLIVIYVLQVVVWVEGYFLIEKEVMQFD